MNPNAANQHVSERVETGKKMKKSNETYDPSIK